MVVRTYSSRNHGSGRLQESRAVEVIFSRYRNLLVLAIVVVGQLLLLGWQVKTDKDVHLLRVWAVTAVTPMAGVVEAVRRNTIGFLEDYFILLDVREQNRTLRSENNKLKLDNIYYRNQLQTADRARALAAFQEKTPSTTVAARIIGNGTASSAQVVFIDRGSTSGIKKGMAVVTPDGIVGKVIAVYPLESQVLLVTDPTFAIGVESQKTHAHGALHCNGSNCIIEYIQNEESIERGEWFYTSGEDRIFPRGFPVGRVSSVKTGAFAKEVHLALSGGSGSVDEVLVILNGIHQPIPTTPPETQVVKGLEPPPADASDANRQTPRMSTEADRIRERYLEVGKEQKHEFGAIGSPLPNFKGVAPKNEADESGGPKPAAGNTPSGGPAASAAKPNNPPKPQPPSGPSAEAARALGASGNSTPAKPPAANRTPSRPVLPLGAPRPKPQQNEPR